MIAMCRVIPSRRGGGDAPHFSRNRIRSFPALISTAVLPRAAASSDGVGNLRRLIVGFQKRLPFLAVRQIDNHRLCSRGPPAR